MEDSSECLAPANPEGDASPTKRTEDPVPNRGSDDTREDCWSTLSSPGPTGPRLLDSPMPDFRVLTPQHWAVKGRHSTPRGLRSTRRPSSRPPERDAEGRGEVSLCVRLKPGYEEEIAYVEGETVKFKLAEKGLMSFLGDQKSENNDWSVCCDHAFGTQTTQEELYDTAVAPIVDAICHGYNGAVIAYGQTGSGKTYTMVGSKNGPGRGVAARAVAGVFAGLRKASWRIEERVSVLEVYNEKVRDLLAPGSTVTTVEVHEGRDWGMSLSGALKRHD
eukprot:g26854.t1